ncbi:MAG: copper ion binding protein [Treponema sp.]|jgi:copper ion binding protein|nr:copper ion binding protein [Treponema sp.]
MKTTIKIEGMSCDHCVAHVTEALREISGVSSVTVSLKNKNAVVEHEENVGPEVLKAAVTEAGYQAL